MLLFLLGISFTIIFLEPFLINFIYFYNIDLFVDFILNQKNSEKLRKYYER